jgi:Protein of unknown function (DUF3631)
MNSAVEPISVSDLSRGIFLPSSTTDVIGDLEKVIRRYLILPSSAYLPLALWCAATRLPDCFDCFPYIALLSPAKRSGKTRVLEVLETLSAKVWRGTAPTAAALYRMMRERPTLLLDEVEGLRGKNISEVQQLVLAVLNAGFRRGATVPRCVGNGQKVEFFPVYGPKAFAAIGTLPDTLSDRSIVISMQRRTAAEKVERFLLTRAKREAESIVEVVDAWAQAHDEDVRAAYESLDDLDFIIDRDAELWMPLFALCSIAAPERLLQLKEDAIALSNAKQAADVEDSLPLNLLDDIWQLWPTGATHLATSALLTKLCEMEESPWSEEKLTARKLAKMLRPFHVQSRQIRLGTITVKGYRFAELEKAARRYLPTLDKKEETKETDCVNTGENCTFQWETAN